MPTGSWQVGHPDVGAPPLDFIAIPDAADQRRSFAGMAQSGYIAGSGLIRSLVIPDLAAMTKAARSAGAPIAIEGAYRSYSTQASTFNTWVNELGYETAILGSARAGHSEHQLGVAIDFKTPGAGPPWHLGGYDWATTRAGAWMVKNAWKFGFIMSYPRGKTSQVCYDYEPWHYRHFGRAQAAAIHASGETSRA